MRALSLLTLIPMFFLSAIAIASSESDLRANKLCGVSNVAINKTFDNMSTDALVSIHRAFMRDDGAKAIAKSCLVKVYANRPAAFAIVYELPKENFGMIFSEK